MLDPKLLRANLDNVAARLLKRGFVLDKSAFLALEAERKKLQVAMQRLQNERNVRSKEVGHAKAKGGDVEEVRTQLKALSDELRATEEQFALVQNKLDDFLAVIPNLPHDSVPEGQSDKDNPVIRTWGEPRVFDFTPKDHVDLGAPGDLMDFETAAKITGTRFVVLRGPLARLQRALGQFMLDLHTREHGYEEISVPFLVNEMSLFGTGQFPKFKEDVFQVLGDHTFYLAPTSEVPVTNTVRDDILSYKQLPMKYVCFSTCFRREAGSYGRDIRGMIRQHQFEKVELVQIVAPETSYQAHETLTSQAEEVLKRLDLPYRVISLCTGDIGFHSAKTYDLEVWLPGQNQYREISSCSNFESFQARRMKARFKNEKGDIEYVHTLNGSGLAVGRTLVAIMENYQDVLGRIHIPKALQPFMDGLKVIEPIAN